MKAGVAEIEIEELVRRLSVPVTPEYLAERRRILEREFPELTPTQKAQQRWGGRSIKVVMQDAERAQAVLVCRLEKEPDPELIDRAWQGSIAYHSRLTLLRSRAGRV